MFSLRKIDFDNSAGLSNLVIKIDTLNSNLDRIAGKLNRRPSIGSSKVELNLDYLKEGLEEIRTLFPKVDRIVNFTIRLDKTLIKLLEENQDKTNIILSKLDSKTQEIEKIVKRLEFDPDNPKPTEIRTEQLAEKIDKVAIQVLEIQKRIEPLIIRLNSII